MLVQNMDAIFTFNIGNGTGPLDLTGAAVSLVFQKGTDVMEKLCTVMNPAQGIVQAVMTKDDLSFAGTYPFQVKITTSSGSVMRSNINGFFVEESLPDGVIVP